MDHPPINPIRFGLSVALELGADYIPRVTTPLRWLRRSLEALAVRIDPGEGYVPLVTPGWDSDDCWHGTDYSKAFEIIERTKAIREAGPLTDGEA